MVSKLFASTSHFHLILALITHHTTDRKCPRVQPSLFTKKRKRFAGGRATKCSHYVRDILCLPKSWCDDPGQVVIPRGERRNKLAKNGLFGKISFTSDLSADDMSKEVCTVFATPMGLTESELDRGKLFDFSFVQRTGAGSRTLCEPAVTSAFKWDGRNVSTLAKSGGIIYIRANKSLHGLQVHVHVYGSLELQYVIPSLTCLFVIHS